MDVTASLANGVILNATPARVEVGQKVRFELRFRRPPPPDLNIQYGFNFADSSPIEWTAVPRTTHSYSSLGTYDPSVEIRVGARVLDLPKIFRTNRPSRYAIKSNTNEHSNVGSHGAISYTPSPTAFQPRLPSHPPPEVHLSVD